LKRTLTETKDLIEEMFCGIGESEIAPSFINLSNYPFEPSSVFPSKTINPCDIKEINIPLFGMPTLVLKERKEIVFITSEQKDELRKFSENNKIQMQPRNYKWNLITDPFLDGRLAMLRTEVSF
jgi:hypothetical protein